MNSQRIAELKAFAKEEGITLPMPAETIANFERMGKVVDLVTGEVLDDVTVQPTSIARAVSYLLGEVEGSVVL